MGSSASSPNEHLYSSLYGREMELMRKMFKANEKMDPLNDGNGSFAGSLRSSNGNGSNFGPYTSPIFGGNASKYFEGLNTNEQATKFAGGLRSDLFEHNVHNSNIGLTPTIKSQASAESTAAPSATAGAEGSGSVLLSLRKRILEHKFSRLKHVKDK